MSKRTDWVIDSIILILGCLCAAALGFLWGGPL